MNYLLSLLPIALYLLILRALDSFSLAKWKLLLACMAFGLLCGVGMFMFTRAVDVPSPVVPVLEEALKSLAVLFLIIRKKVRFLHEALIYGAAAGAGFSLLENLAQENNVANPLLLMCFAVVVFLSLFIILFGYGEKRIYKWMDHSLTVDIQTLSAIRSGNFASTRAGQYMMAIKEQFKPECFFDMVCYVQLSLDLKIEKQSYMLLCQVGYEGEAMGKTLEEHVAKKTELNALKKRIGKTGMMVLAPLVA